MKFGLRQFVASTVSKRFFALAASILGIGTITATAAPINLGAASGYSVFALDSLSFNGPGVINGDVAVGKSTNFAAPAQINGTVYENPGVPAQGNVTPTGGFVKLDLSTAIGDAKAAATLAGSLTATQSFNTLGNNATVTGNGGTNVIDIGSGGIKLSSGVLTLTGTANDVFIINDAGAFTFSNSGIVLGGGVKAENVLFNISGDVALTGGGTANFAGTILAPFSDVSIHDKTLTGAVIGNTIEDTSGFKVINSTQVPEPAGLSVIGIAAAGLLARRRRRA
jgi:hypothetical protein